MKLQAPSDLTYLHGGYGELLVALEFGEYDAALLRVEPAERYGEGIAVGMEVEEDARFYAVTDVAEGKVVLDANHPLAGMALRFFIEIITVRSATAEEMRRGVSLP